MSKIYRGFHPSVEGRAARLSEDKNQMPFRGAIFTKVLQGDGDSERVRVQGIAGTKVGPFAYPFASQNAWIRGQPEPLTTMISVIGGDTMDIQPVGYYDPAKSVAARNYKDLASEARQFPAEDIQPKVKPYRVLAPGELDLASNFAQTFLGKTDVHQSRGGLSHLTLTSRETSIETPMLTVRGAAHSVTSSGTLNDEMRFGTVRRSVPTVSSPTRPSLVKAIGLVNIRSPEIPVFAKEHSVLLDWFGSPGKLIDHRQGNVIEDNGQWARSVQTAKNLRARFQWYSVNGFTTAEVDDAGNSLFETSRDAAEGAVINVPAGDIKIKVGGQGLIGGGKFSLQATNDIQFSTDRRAALVAQRGFRFQTPQKGTIKADAGIDITAEGGTIRINTPTLLGVKVGSGGLLPRAQYPVLVAQPDYLTTLNSYYGAQTAFSQSAATYGAIAAEAWAAIGPIMMLVDPSGVLMSLCLAAGEAADAMYKQAISVTPAITAHLPRLTQMPSGFISTKLISE